LWHEAGGATLAKIRELTGNYRSPADACQTFKALYEALEPLEVDLHEHIHLPGEQNPVSRKCDT
jgi:regulator of cell morphogenesis and NO signaling